MSVFFPKMYQKSIYDINYKKLKKKGIKCLLFDLDNTCVPYKEKVATLELNNLFLRLKKLGFRVIIFSNSPSKRLQRFKNLGVEYNASSCKPFSKNFYKVISKYDYDVNEICIIGDQLFTDILGGNRVGIVTCLIEPLTDIDMIVTNISRFFEKILFMKWSKKGKFKKGEYYD